jgi:dipeptidase E
MKFYLSSYQFGDNPAALKELVPGERVPLGLIPNALDFTSADPIRRKTRIDSEITALSDMGFAAELLDLRVWFGKRNELVRKIESLKALWVLGGNTFVLRQAMKLSGFDEILIGSRKRDLLYAGYSAGCCVLSPDLKAYSIVDNPADFPYREIQQTIWQGLGMLDFAFMPHFNSNHPESADIDKEIAACIEKGIPFKAFRDGEVLILQD